MERFEITEDEKVFIIRRRELATKRANIVANPVKKTKAKDAILGTNRPPGWDEHCDMDKPHSGRVTQNHPLYKFEEELFKTITNLQHKDQHKLIRKVLNLPVQNVFRDRSYHIFSHLDMLWAQEMLPLKYKIWYEELKEKHSIDETNVHEDHKKLKPDYKYPKPNIKRIWDKDNYPAVDKDEKFVVGKTYRYEHDDKVGYKYKEAYKEELGA